MSEKMAYFLILMYCPNLMCKFYFRHNAICWAALSRRCKPRRMSCWPRVRTSSRHCTTTTFARRRSSWDGRPRFYWKKMKNLKNSHNQPSGKYVKKDFLKEMIKVAQPVIKWLEEAEEDSEEDEDEGIVAFDDRSRAVGTTVVEEKQPMVKKTAEPVNKGEPNKEPEEDVDIDNI